MPGAIRGLNLQGKGMGQSRRQGKGRGKEKFHITWRGSRRSSRLDSTSLFSQALPAREPPELVEKPPATSERGLQGPHGVWGAGGGSVFPGNGAPATGLVPFTEGTIGAIAAGFCRDFPSEFPRGKSLPLL